MVRKHYTVADVAGEVGLHAQTLRRLEALGRIPAAKRDGLSGYRVYTAADLQAIKDAIRRLSEERTVAIT